MDIARCGVEVCVDSRTTTHFLNDISSPPPFSSLLPRPPLPRYFNNSTEKNVDAPFAEPTVNPTCGYGEGVKVTFQRFNVFSVKGLQYNDDGMMMALVKPGLYDSVYPRGRSSYIL